MERKISRPINWTSKRLETHEENLSPLYHFYKDKAFRRFEDASGRYGWIVGEYAPIVQHGRPDIPGQVVVYYDAGYLAVIDPSRIRGTL